jgi:AcrR family transcriptional regulator
MSIENVHKVDLSTEEKIKTAARKLFLLKGSSATTREIAAEAGINLALLNYYFRKKELLFDLIMKENVGEFRLALATVINNPDTDLQTKIRELVEAYINILQKQPDLAFFVLTEMKNSPDKSIGEINSATGFAKSVLLVQIEEAVGCGEIRQINPLHLLLNIFGLTVFPYVGRPMIRFMGKMEDEAFYEFLEERKRLVPEWIMASLRP